MPSIFVSFLLLSVSIQLRDCVRVLYDCYHLDVWHPPLGDKLLSCLRAHPRSSKTSFSLAVAAAAAAPVAETAAAAPVVAAAAAAAPVLSTAATASVAAAAVLMDIRLLRCI